jgi:hypothetical protein
MCVQIEPDQKVPALAHVSRQNGDGVSIDIRPVGVGNARSVAPERCGDGRRLVLAENCSAATARLQDGW